jgi:4a-hydroxytetrahydrobiopterin dehydratase
MSDRLESRRCRACEAGTAPMTGAQARALLPEVPGWAVEEGRLTRTFTFKNYHQTTAFVNAVAWIAHTEDHHPDISFGYKTCTVRYVTHSIGGLSENDFICAARINALLRE